MVGSSLLVAITTIGCARGLVVMPSHRPPVFHYHGFSPSARTVQPSAVLAAPLVSVATPFARRAVMATAALVNVAVWVPVANAVRRKMENSDAIIESAKMTCATMHDDDVCEVVYSSDWSWWDRLTDTKLRKTLATKVDVDNICDM